MADMTRYKSKVAPLAQVSIPRLELCAAVLLHNLIKTVRENPLFANLNVTCWSDSTVTLHWIADSPTRWTTFVANRVAEIQSGAHTWKHVQSRDNPADLISRGVSPSQPSEGSIWWYEPRWLRVHENSWPKSSYIPPTNLPESRVHTFISLPGHTWNIFSTCSKFHRMRRSIAYTLRFIYNCRNPSSRRTDELSVDELQGATDLLVYMAQMQVFAAEYAALLNGKQLKPSSTLLCLNPFIYNGLIRVGGRVKIQIENLENSPAILPAKHRLTNLIIQHRHEQMLHVGSQALLASLREQFWIVSGRRAIRRELSRCVTCFRYKPKHIIQQMGQLPQERTTPSRPFTNTGVDYAGPISIKLGTQRCTKTSKAYICLFICMVTKAIHLELVTSLTTPEFINALTRFISRRGRPHTMFSDNGTNFVRANRVLKDLVKVARESNVQNFLVEKEIRWQFMPPRAPHMGGLWEAGIKSMELHLRRMLGKSAYTYEQLQTVLTGIEAYQNSHPLSPISNDPLDLNPLTPGHFLIGSALTALPLPETSASRGTNRYHRMLDSVKDFWTRWSKEYLMELQVRNRWKTPAVAQPQIGDMVLIKEDYLPPQQWIVGRVIQTHPGEDSLVRVISVNTSSGIIKRPTSKICLFPKQIN